MVFVLGHPDYMTTEAHAESRRSRRKLMHTFKRHKHVRAPQEVFFTSTCDILHTAALRATNGEMNEESSFPPALLCICMHLLEKEK